MKAKRKSKPQRITKVIVEKVETDWVGVHWQCRAYSKDGAWSDQAQPKFVVEGEDLKKLKLLNVFEPSTLQVGDRNFYVMKGNENVITREQWRKQQKENYQVPKHSPRKTRSSAAKCLDDKLKDKDKERDKDKEKCENETNAQNQRRDNSAQRNVNSVSSNVLMPPSHNQNAESSDDWDTEDTGSQSDTASVF